MFCYPKTWLRKLTKDEFIEVVSIQLINPKQSYWALWGTFIVRSAEYVKTDKPCDKMGECEYLHYKPVEHHGIKITTVSDEEYLLLISPDKGPINVCASYMSPHWHTIQTIQVTGDKQIGDVLCSAGYLNGFGHDGYKCDYQKFYGKTSCIGSVYCIEEYLKN